MTICKDCGRTISETYIFCPWCGKSKVERVASMNEEESLLESLKKKCYEEQTKKIMQLEEQLETLEKELSILVLSAEMHK